MEIVLPFARELVWKTIGDMIELLADAGTPIAPKDRSALAKQVRTLCVLFVVVERKDAAEQAMIAMMPSVEQLKLSVAELAHRYSERLKGAGRVNRRRRVEHEDRLRALGDQLAKGGKE